jgi:ubiquinone/menaquinone biosynthesis C-methylase UbiE
MNERKALERATGRLFGELWAPFNDRLFEESVALFGKRLELAGINLAWFEGKVCLDAGCGGGRNSVAMARLGAKEVLGIDLGEKGLVDASRRAAELGHGNIRFQRASVLDIPAPSASFDMVWCAGVVMITDDAERALDELVRVLRPGGQLYLLVYATEGLRWPLILLLRPLAALIGLEKMEEAITASGLPANKRRTYIDDLYCPRLDFYDWPRLRRMLEKRGMSSIDRWGDHVRLDHERDLSAYVSDLASLAELFDAGCRISTGLTKALFVQGRQMIQATIAGIESAVSAIDRHELTEGQAMRALIGQGHHRVLAVKGEAHPP